MTIGKNTNLYQMYFNFKFYSGVRLLFVILNLIYLTKKNPIESVSSFNKALVPSCVCWWKWVGGPRSFCPPTMVPNPLKKILLFCGNP